jgi:spermidine synthase
LPRRTHLSRRAYLAIAFLVGFTSLFYEVYSAKVLFLYFVESTQAVAVTLSAFLAGLGTSALICSRRVSAERRAAHALLVGLLVAAAVYALGVLRRHELIPAAADLAQRAFGDGVASDVSRLLFAWSYLFLPGLFIGGAFPLLTGLYVNDLEARTRDTGVVYFWDTLGAIFGALAAGFLLLPWLGLKRAVLVPAALDLFMVAALVERRLPRAAAATSGVVCLVLAFAGARGALSSAAATSDLARARPDLGRMRIIAQEESPFGRVTVSDDPTGKSGNRTLFIGFRDMCHGLLSTSEALLAESTLTQLSPGARVLNIGLGCGITAGTIARSDKIVSLEIAEINPVVARMARAHFGEYNHHVLELEKTHLFVQDGAELLRQTPRTYDAIVIDVEEPTVVHSSPLYTREYFEIARGKLSPGGVLALWALADEPEAGKIIDNTLRAVFPNVEVRVPSRFPNFTFYASTRPLSLHPTDPREGIGAGLEQHMKALPVRDVNTLDDRALERSFDIRRAFGLPRGYDEPVFSDLERARARAGR